MIKMYLCLLLPQDKLPLGNNKHKLEFTNM